MAAVSRLRLIACNALLRELCHLVSRSPHVIDLEFNELDAHRHSKSLRDLIQQRIDAADGGGYDAILLGYGLCGNATVGLRAGATRVVVPRAHDCCTLLLGSRGEFKRHFRDNPSQPFSSTGYSERSVGSFHEGFEKNDQDALYREYVEKYGEENARYIVEAMSAPAHAQNRIVFIETPGTAALGGAARCEARARAEGREFVRLTGSLELLRKLVDAEWDSDFLVLEPGRKIGGVYDWDEIVRAED
jgi:hypothetical protein